MLDNMRSTHAFFGSKVLLVEGETDRYFFRASIEEIESRTKLGLVQDIAVINIDGKDSSKEWRILFESFGLEVHYVADLDYAFKLYSEQALKLNTQVKINNFLSSHPDLDTKIEAEYLNKVYILKKGALEDYLAIPKGLSHVITFCEDQIGTFIVGTDEKNVEISDILQRVTGK